MEKLRDYSIAEIRDDLPNRADETESAEDSGFSPSGDTLKGFAITPSERIKALRNLRLAGINPTSAAIREEVLALRDQSATGDSSPPGFTLPVAAESSQSAFLVDVLQKELIERDEFLADARVRTAALLDRIQSLSTEIGELRIAGETARETAAGLEAALESVSGQAVREAAANDSTRLEALLEEERGKCALLEEQIEALRVDLVLAQSLERIVEEQKLSLEQTGQRADALQRHLEESAHRLVRLDQAEARLLEAESTLTALRSRESELKKRLADFEEQITRMGEERLSWESRNRSLERQIDLRSAELETALGDLESANLARSGLEAQVAELRGQLSAPNAELEAALESLERANFAKAGLEAQVAELRAQLSAPSPELEAALGDLERARELHTKAQKENAEAIGRLNLEVEGLRESLRTARAGGIAPERLREAEERIAGAESTAAEARKAFEVLEAESTARITVLQATITELEATVRELEKPRAEKDALLSELAEGRAVTGRLEAGRAALEVRISDLLDRQAAEAGEKQRLEKKNLEATRLLESTSARHQSEIDTLRAEAVRLSEEVAVLRSGEESMLRSLEEREKRIAELQEKIADFEARRKEDADPGNVEELRHQITEHREALRDAREQNHQLLERFEGTVKAFAGNSKPVPGFPLLRPVLAAMVFLALVGAAGFGVWKWVPHWIPSVEEMRQSMETFEQLKQQNAALAADLNATLDRLNGAKQEEVTIAEMRALRERLLAAEEAVARYEQESTVNMARTTKLQSDLELARQRLARISAELTNRDLKILELERLLGEAGAAVLQLPPTPRLTLAAPLIETALPGLPQLPDPSLKTSEAGDVAADSLRTLQHQAEEAWKAKNFGLAEVLFQRLVESLPNNGLAFSNLAAVQLELGKLSLAKENINRAIELEPQDAFSRTTLGMILLRSGDSQGARDALLLAIERDPKSADALHYLGVALDQQGDRKRAIEEIEKAIALSPGYSEAHFNLAVLYSQGGAEEREKARSHYRTAIDLGADPSHELDELLR